MKTVSRLCQYWIIQCNCWIALAYTARRYRESSRRSFNSKPTANQLTITMYELLCHLRVRLGQQTNTGQVAKNKVLGCTSQAYADDLLRQAKINQSKLEKNNCFKGKLTLALIRESSSQGYKKDKNIITGGGVFLGVGSLGKQEGCVG